MTWDAYTSWNLAWPLAQWKILVMIVFWQWERWSAPRCLFSLSTSSLGGFLFSHCLSLSSHQFSPQPHRPQSPHTTVPPSLSCASGWPGRGDPASSPQDEAPEEILHLLPSLGSLWSTDCTVHCVSVAIPRRLPTSLTCGACFLALDPTTSNSGLGTGLAPCFGPPNWATGIISLFWSLRGHSPGHPCIAVETEIPIFALSEVSSEWKMAGLSHHAQTRKRSKFCHTIPNSIYKDNTSGPDDFSEMKKRQKSLIDPSSPLGVTHRTRSSASEAGSPGSRCQRWVPGESLHAGSQTALMLPQPHTMEGHKEAPGSFLVSPLRYNGQIMFYDFQSVA